MVPDLRKESRRKYLTKRKDDKLIELQDDIADDEFLFEEDQVHRCYNLTIFFLLSESQKSMRTLFFKNSSLF